RREAADPRDPRGAAGLHPRLRHPREDPRGADLALAELHRGRDGRGDHRLARGRPEEGGRGDHLEVIPPGLRLRPPPGNPRDTRATIAEVPIRLSLSFIVVAMGVAIISSLVAARKKEGEEITSK